MTKKSRGTFAGILALGIIIGTLAWELLERLITLTGRDFSLSAGPLGLDLRVISVMFMVNPGTLLGVVAALLLFRRI